MELNSLLHGLAVVAIGGLGKVIWTMRIDLTRTSTQVDERLAEIHSVVNGRLDAALAKITELEAEIHKLTKGRR